MTWCYKIEDLFNTIEQMVEQSGRLIAGLLESQLIKVTQWDEHIFNALLFVSSNESGFGKFSLKLTERCKQQLDKFFF